MSDALKVVDGIEQPEITGGIKGMSEVLIESDIERDCCFCYDEIKAGQRVYRRNYLIGLDPRESFMHEQCRERWQENKDKYFSEFSF